MAIRIGTSGWNYAEWRGRFYPEDLSEDRWLSYYSERFDSVEVNSTFYGLPERTTVEGWVKQVGEDFLFAVKASRYLTHLKHLKDPEEPLERLLGRTEPMGSHHGPLLVQLPGRWNPDPERLEAFLEICPSNLRVAVEFRAPAWYVDEVKEVLHRHEAALVWNDFPEAHSPHWETAPFLYVRFHGSGDDPYTGRYGTEGLGSWVERLEAWEGDLYCYFNNDIDGNAVEDARTLRELL